MTSGAWSTRGEAVNERAWLGLPLPRALPRQEDRPAQGLPDVHYEALGGRQAPEAVLWDDVPGWRKQEARAMEDAGPTGPLRGQRRPDAFRRPRHPADQ